MTRNQITGGLAITAISSLAFLAGSASAWDSLPCGETEATAHLCAPGELARDGTIPVPLPVPTPELVPVTPTPIEPLPRVVTTPKPKPLKPARSCAFLRSVRAYALRHPRKADGTINRIYFRCHVVPPLRRGVTG